jgi:hypothetical protein
MFSMYAAVSCLTPGRLLFFDSRRRQPAQGGRTVKSRVTDELHSMLARDTEQRRRSRVVRRLQADLRAAITAHAWERYLTLEEAEAARAAQALERVARWAFARGRRAAVRSRVTRR